MHSFSTAHTLRKGKGEAQRVEWRSFMMQSGSSYKHARQFRAKVIEALGTVTPYLKHLRIEADEKGLTLHPAAPCDPAESLK